MNAAGNYQWDDLYPNLEKFSADVDNGDLWVVCVPDESISDGSDERTSSRIVAMVAITMHQDEEYADVDGWDTSIKCVVPHRMAVDPTYQGRHLAHRSLSLSNQSLFIYSMKSRLRFFFVDVCFNNRERSGDCVVA